MKDPARLATDIISPEKEGRRGQEGVRHQPRRRRRHGAGDQWPIHRQQATGNMHQHRATVNTHQTTHKTHQSTHNT